jgi:two-component system LytT family sensor kinase
MRRYSEPFLHIVFWVLLAYLAFNNLGMKMIVKSTGEVEQVTRFRTDLLIMLIVDMMFKISLFYIAALKVIPVFLSHRSLNNSLKLMLLFSITLICGLAANYVLVVYFLDYDPSRPSRLFSLSLLLHFFTLFLALAYSLSKERFKAERHQKEIEGEKMKTELDFLKSQVNPHFLFNTLNNLYAESKKHKNPTLSNGIAKLSHMMRYMIYDSNETFVYLDKEIEFLDSFIELQMLRISPNDPFELTKEVGPYNSSIKIAPILLQPIVENAFKHGIKLEEQSYIDIKLFVKESKLLFSVKNSKSNNSRSIEHSGIGLSNIRRRLELIYPENHSLQIEENSDHFSVTLELHINEMSSKNMIHEAEMHNNR